MTIKNRNRLLLSGCVFSFILILAAVFVLFYIYTASKTSQIDQGARFIDLPKAGVITEYRYEAVFCSIFALMIFAAVSLCVILFRFKKTQVNVIIFLSLFAFSCLFEGFRLVVPLCDIMDLPSAAELAASRIVFCGRLLAFFSLFAAGIFSNGKMSSQLGRIFLLLVVCAAFIAAVIPYNTSARCSAMVVLPGYMPALCVLVAFIAIATPVCFFLEGTTQNIFQYRRAAAVFLFLVCGYIFLLVADNWLTFIVGAFLLYGGMQSFISLLHGYYMWN